MKEFINKLESSQTFKTLVIILVILLCAYLIFLIVFELIPIRNLSIEEKADIASTIKNIFHTLFFIITSCVAILSYRQAKETLFNPIRTEIFKLQILEFEKLLLFFQNKTETDFSKAFDMDTILNTNAILMIDDYVMTFFKDEAKIDIEARKEMTKIFHGAVVSKEFMLANFSSPDYHEKHDKPDEPEIKNPALILKKWQNYTYGKINFTKEFSENDRLISEFLASPLLPAKLKELLSDFHKVVHENLSSVGEVLTEVSQELPEKFPNFESLEDIGLSGIWNRYNRKSKSYEEPAKEILSYINKYLKIEKLIEAST